MSLRSISGVVRSYRLQPAPPATCTLKQRGSSALGAALICLSRISAAAGRKQGSGRKRKTQEAEVGEGGREGADSGKTEE